MILGTDLRIQSGREENDLVDAGLGKDDEMLVGAGLETTLGMPIVVIVIGMALGKGAGDDKEDDTRSGEVLETLLGAENSTSFMMLALSSLSEDGVLVEGGVLCMDEWRGDC